MLHRFTLPGAGQAQRPWALAGVSSWPGKPAPVLEGVGTGVGCCPLCTLSLGGRSGQTPGFICPRHRVPWTESAGPEWPGVAVAAPSLGARWEHQSPLSGPSPRHTAESSSVLTRPQRGCASPSPPQSKRTRGSRGHGHPSESRRPLAGDGPSASPSRVPVRGRLCCPSGPGFALLQGQAWPPLPLGPRRPPLWAAKARAQCGSPGPVTAAPLSLSMGGCWIPKGGKRLCDTRQGHLGQGT